MLMMKRCMKCHEVKPLSDFYVHPEMGDGYLGKCKECTKMDVRLNYLRNIERIREYDRTRPRRAPWYDPYKRHIHSIVQYAVKSGKLTKPASCSICGVETTVLHAHHDDYSKPIDVVWACVTCHHNIHGRITDPEAKATELMSAWLS